VNAVVVNTGSSSVRLSSWRIEGTQRAETDRLRLEQPDPPSVDALRRMAGGQPGLVAHRIVHGGERLVSPVVIDGSIETELERLAPLAPLHNPRALRWIRAARDCFGARVAQVAVFDTAFFAGLPEVARTYALPRDLSQRLGLRRFGFHGLAHQAMWRAWRSVRPDLPGGGRLITLQLGSGCSAAAIDRGAPLDTSMGFSPLEGLVMATRPGDLDPGLLLHLQKAAGLGGAELEELLNHGSGLAGLAGHDGDLRNILGRDGAAERLAVEVYCYRARKYVGAYLAVLGGVDGIVFGGGVGEHQPEIRARILAGMEWAGIRIDASLNQQQGARGEDAAIGAGPVDVRVVVVDEAAAILEDALQAPGLMAS
jgi:acetate kinase